MKRFVIVGADGSPYLTRWTLLETRWGTLRLHKFHRSDEDACLHDHPWPFTSLILRGGYWEETQVTACPIGGACGLSEDVCRCVGRARIWYAPFTLLRRAAAWRHRVIIPEGKTAWTLIWCGRVERKWGFWTRRGWMHWRTFLNHDERQAICGDDA